MEPDEASPAPASVSWSVVVLALLLTTAALTLAESGYYRARFQWDRLELPLWDQLLLAWLVASKSLCFLGAGLLLTAPLLTRPSLRWRTANVVCVGVFTFLASDLRFLMATGNHASKYLRFLGDHDPWEWGGGGPGSLAGPIFESLVAVSLAVLLLMALGRALGRRLPALRHPRAGWAATALLGGLIVGPWLGAPTASRPLVLMRLQADLPITLPLLSPGTGGGAGEQDFFRLLNNELHHLRTHRWEAIQTARPVDADVQLPRQRQPDVVLVVLESFRRDGLDPRWMPRVSAWAEQGLRLDQHYAGTHASYLGLYSLLYGRTPAAYAPTLDARVPAQLCHSLRQAGYRTVFFSSATLDWQRMDEYLTGLNFDGAVADHEGAWPDRDRRTLERVRNVLKNTDQPCFAMAFLMSSHFDYRYPPEYERFVPAAEHRSFSYDGLRSHGHAGEAFRQTWLNRYHNALAYLDDQLGDFLEGVDPTRTVVVLTGDHGESFYDDGAWLHGSRLSDVQTQVPMVLVGPGLPAERRSAPSSHLDLVPTLFHALAGEERAVAHAHGRDLLGAEPVSTTLFLVDNLRTQFALLHGGERLHLRLSDAGELQSLGFQDRNGAFLPSFHATPAASSRWFQALRHELGRLAR